MCMTFLRPLLRGRLFNTAAHFNIKHNASPRYWFVTSMRQKGGMFRLEVMTNSRLTARESQRVPSQKNDELLLFFFFNLLRSISSPLWWESCTSKHQLDHCAISSSMINVCKEQPYYCKSGADEQELATPKLSLCHGIFTDWSIFSTPLLLWLKGSSGPVTQWRHSVSCDWLWHSHGSLIESRFDLKINRYMKTPWQEYSWVACSYS